MARESKSKFAILGLLAMGPRSGYDIKKAIEDGLCHFWNESYGQIYPTLNSLAEDGLAVRATERTEGKPDRHVYTITDSGLAELHAWLTEPAEYHRERLEVLLKLFFGSAMTLEECLQHVTRFRDEYSEKLNYYLAIEQRVLETRAGHPNQPFWLMTVSCGIWTSQAFIDWCNETIATLRKMSAESSNR